MRRYLYEHSLAIVMLGLFAIILVGQSVVGHAVKNDDLLEHGQAATSYPQYLTDGHFVEAVFENWESEFLQMAAFVIFTVFLRQKGSPESKDLRGEEPIDRDPQKSRRRRNLPWPVRRGGLWLRIYEYSLSLALLLLFAFSFTMHAIGGAAEYSSEQLEHGGEAVGPLAFVTTSQFWFESLQNWQSEFLAVGALVVLSVYLRQKGSPESKPVDAPHSETGSE
jgi:hypothetical protein